ELWCLFAGGPLIAEHGEDFCWPPRRAACTVVVRPTSAVLIGHVAPAPVCQRCFGPVAKYFYRLAFVRISRAQVFLVIPDVVGELNLVSRRDRACYFCRGYIGRLADWIGKIHLVRGVNDGRAIFEHKLARMRHIPPRKGYVDCLGEGLKGVRGADREDPAG